jgi:hypothetical protein
MLALLNSTSTRERRGKFKQGLTDAAGFAS